MSKDKSHILVVDDNQTNRLMLYLGVQQLGHLAKAAEGGHQALEMLREDDFDAVLLDILMPGMSGFEVLQAAKSDEELRHIPIIIVSAETDMESIAHGIELGAEDFLPKPFNPLILRARLNASLEKKKYRDLERAYLDQELMLRQTEVLAAIGKLSAGMAHELNNSVAAAQRGAEQIQHLIDQSQEYQRGLGGLHLSTEQVDFLDQLNQRTSARKNDGTTLSPIERSDRELELESALQAAGVTNSWEYSSALADSGVTAADVGEIASQFEPNEFGLIVGWLNGALTLDSVVRDVRISLSQVSGIVSALKTYSYLDQAPVQYLDVREAIKSTLSVMQASIPEDIAVHCEFAAEVPPVKANGSQLNLVWTNILDNAVYALENGGEITVRISSDEQWVNVEIIDDGPGVPAEIQGRVFEPFFTTKPPGHGAGLGLSVSHTIIVQNHSGQISLSSHPGETNFTVRLPVAD